MPKIIHYAQKCIGCGICQQMQPQLWRMSKKNGKAVLLQAQVKKDIAQLSIHMAEHEMALEVAKACPVNIIKIV